MAKKFKAENRFLQTEIPGLSPAEIPLGNQEYLEVIGSDAYEFVVAIPFPAMGNDDQGNRIPYFRDFFESFETWVKQRAVPGSNNLDDGGHTDESADVYTVGTRIVGEGKTGIFYGRVAVPKAGTNGSNEGLITALKLKAVEMSIVANVDASSRGGEYGVYGILSPPRNDIVGVGSMEQKIFANKKFDEQDIFRRVAAGDIDFETDGDELLLNGKVCKRAALRLQNSEYKTLAGRVLNAIADYSKSKNKDKEPNMALSKEEMAEIAKTVLDLQNEEKKKAEEAENAKVKNAVSEEQVNEIRKAISDIGIDITDKDTLADLFEKVGKRLEDNADMVAENAVTAWARGKTYKNAEGKEVRSPLFDIGMATVKLGGKKRGNETWVRNALKELDQQESTKNLREQLINPFSALNGGQYGNGIPIRVEA